MGDGVNLSFSEAVYMLQRKRETLRVVPTIPSTVLKKKKKGRNQVIS